MAKDVLHVVPQGGGGWAVKREGSDRPSSTHDTQKTAIDGARTLAKEGDDIVIHRPDGSFRNRVTYKDSSTNLDDLDANGSSGNGSGGRARPEAHDLWSVGSRVSWSAVIAGVVVAVACSALLTALAAAIGMSTVDYARPKTVTITAAAIWVFILLVSMFAGGYVATRATTRETQLEAAIAGTLVWGTTMALAALGMGAGTGLALDATRTAKVVTADQPFWRGLNWTEDQAKRYEGLTAPDRVGQELKLDDEGRRKYEEARAQANEAVKEMKPQLVAWWIFAGMALSVSAAIAGALLGSGPEVTRATLRREAPLRAATATEANREVAAV